MEMGKLGGRKYRKQFLNKKENRDKKSEQHEEAESRCWPQSRMTNTPEDLDEQVNGLMVGARGGSVRLNADAVRSGGVCHGHSLLGHSLLNHHGFLLLTTFLLCVRALILWGRGLHQPHIFTVFFHPREDTVFLSCVS